VQVKFAMDESGMRGTMGALAGMLPPPPAARPQPQPQGPGPNGGTPAPGINKK
jgi:hypothetical protein